MNTKAASNVGTESERQDSWLPMIVIAMGQTLMSLNVAASMGGGAPIALSLLVLAAGMLAAGSDRHRCGSTCPNNVGVCRSRYQSALISREG